MNQFISLHKILQTIFCIKVLAFYADTISKSKIRIGINSEYHHHHSYENANRSNEDMFVDPL
jgi:hypothetical protein